MLIKCFHSALNCYFIPKTIRCFWHMLYFEFYCSVFIFLMCEIPIVLVEYLTFKNRESYI